MKTNIFKKAIINRKKIRFLYNLQEIMLEPYFLSTTLNGKKVVFGRVNGTSEVKMFNYDKILNIKVLEWKKFSPIIPIIPTYN